MLGCCLPGSCEAPPSPAFSPCSLVGLPLFSSRVHMKLMPGRENCILGQCLVQQQPWTGAGSVRINSLSKLLGEELFLNVAELVGCQPAASPNHSGGCLKTNREESRYKRWRKILRPQSFKLIHFFCLLFAHIESQLTCYGRQDNAPPTHPAA